jgi:sarcosine oxidase subunit gamma
MPQRQIVSMIARRDGLETLRSAIRERFKVDLQDKPVLVRGSDVSFLWCGHQQWFAMADGDTADLSSTLRQQIGTSASLSDQSDSRLIVELSGSATRGILAKLAPIDFHPRAFPVGATALTSLEHVGCQITRTGDEPTYELMAFRSFADSVLHGILTAGAEFGVDVA